MKAKITLTVGRTKLTFSAYLLVIETPNVKVEVAMDEANYYALLNMTVLYRPAIDQDGFRIECHTVGDIDPGKDDHISFGEIISLPRRFFPALGGIADAFMYGDADPWGSEE